MAGNGPAPQSRRARTNKDPIPMKVITAEPAKQPELPEEFIVRYRDKEGILHVEGRSWPARTREWWQMWADSPLSNDFTTTDWSELLDTARLHAEYWSGDLKVAGELRLRVAKFGATPEDRARLRIQFAAADEAEKKSAKPQPSARARRGPLKAV
ncbi:hypothetical protein ABW16_21505 [Mycolicibacter heraklionensis]|uniref:Terminase small subunit n=1 Tax=Mycolicibacter heraklionensis TaxID=512402 RepID=A0ABR5FA04_9MYCO|nr:hypothetical protein [Mycolicibacter heraklionensis]KLO25892.1 hypothetical protein ABW16_21505 [Mycolicibacter heraklionensis]